MLSLPKVKGSTPHLLRKMATSAHGVMFTSRKGIVPSTGVLESAFIWATNMLKEGTSPFDYFVLPGFTALLVWRNHRESTAVQDPMACELIGVHHEAGLDCAQNIRVQGSPYSLFHPPHSEETTWKWQSRCNAKKEKGGHRANSSLSSRKLLSSLWQYSWFEHAYYET